LGSSGDNELEGWEGNDTINGGAGNDTIWKGAGDDLLMGALTMTFTGWTLPRVM
jgi:Ca2+-binding RTX toxin-like protein